VVERRWRREAMSETGVGYNSSQSGTEDRFVAVRASDLLIVVVA